MLRFMVIYNSLKFSQESTERRKKKAAIKEPVAPIPTQFVEQKFSQSNIQTMLKATHHMLLAKSLL